MGKDFTKQEEAFAELLNIMETLREKCPWDHKQTMESLRTLSVEEVYELGDAILKNDMQEVKKELGDLLMHIVFYALIGKEQEQFDMTDVLNEICAKLRYRHPHIYGEVKVEDENDVLRNWEQLKLKEKGRHNKVLEGVPGIFHGLPGTNQGKLAVKIHFTDFLLVEVFRGLVVFNFASELRAKFRCIKTSNRTGHLFLS